jgi:single-stranded DNA-binding protein
MAAETPITLVGNLTGDPELHVTAAGATVASFTVASTPRPHRGRRRGHHPGRGDHGMTRFDRRSRAP